MGYNTVVLFSNDRIHDALKNAHESMTAIYTHALGDDSKHPPHGITVMPTYHADLSPIFIGGANSLTWIGDVNWTQRNSIPAILRTIAEKHGYKIAIRKRPD